jgi:DNA-directed RNA polymerase subunit E'
LFYLASILGSFPLPKTFEIKSWNDENVINSIKEKYHSRILNEDMLVVMVLGNVIPTNTTLMDGKTKSYSVIFDVLLFIPKIREIIPSSVSQIRESDMVARIGSFDAYVHKSQILDGKSKIDFINQTVTSSNKSIRVGTIIRGKITSVSFPHTGPIKIGMTCAQPYLGVIDE